MIRKKLLGAIFLRKGLLTEEQLGRALRKQRQLFEERRLIDGLAGAPAAWPQAGTASLLGQILLRMGLVSRLRLAEALREQQAALEEYGGVESGRLGIAVEMGSIVSSTLCLTEVLNRILRHAGRVAESAATVLALLDEEAREAAFIACAGPVARRLAVPRSLQGGGAAARVLRSGAPLRLAAASGEPDPVPEVEPLRGFAIRAVLGVPLRGPDGMIGALLAINRTTGGPFTPQDELLLGVFAGQCSLAIEHARSHEALRRQLSAPRFAGSPVSARTACGSAPPA